MQKGGRKKRWRLTLRWMPKGLLEVSKKVGRGKSQVDGRREVYALGEKLLEESTVAGSATRVCEKLRKQWRRAPPSRKTSKMPLRRVRQKYWQVTGSSRRRKPETD